MPSNKNYTVIDIRLPGSIERTNTYNYAANTDFSKAQTPTIKF